MNNTNESKTETVEDWSPVFKKYKVSNQDPRFVETVSYIDPEEPEVIVTMRIWINPEHPLNKV
jgi:hypothetical protein